MNLDEDEIRGSNPAMSTKDVLMELRDDFKEFRNQDFQEVRDNVVILVAADIPRRVLDLENFKNKMLGLGLITGVLGVIAVAVSIFAAVSG